ncbi:MAG: PEP-CTERM sorting domain-containing protein [Phycisphaerales bacterium]|nr:PEP-CTERM sorting domain-containing protein [Phycisphaerales bacterium]
MKRITTLAVTLLASQSLMAANITYLNHFDTAGNFDADYGAAPAAVITGTPVTGPGFTGFGGGSQGMTLDYLTDYVNYAAVGNVTPTDGISLGFWVSQNWNAADHAGGYQYYHYAGIQREDFPSGTDGLNAAYSGGSAYLAEVNGDAPGSTPNFYRATGGGWFYLTANRWLYYNVDYKAPQVGVPDSGHYRIRVYDANGNILNEHGAVTGIILLDPGQQDSFDVLSNMEINVGAGTYGIAGDPRQMTIDELAVWDSSLSESEVDSIVAGMVAGNPLSVPEPASAAVLLTVGAACLVRRRRSHS